MNFFKKMFKTFDDWKSIIGYILISVPWVGTYPMLKGAIEDLLANPTSEQTWANLVAQAILAGGIFHRIVKNFAKF